jgi:hypothetical protein
LKDSTLRRGRGEKTYFAIFMFISKVFLSDLMIRKLDYAAAVFRPTVGWGKISDNGEGVMNSREGSVHRYGTK